MKQEHKKILTIIEQYLEKYPDLRFGQALYNLNINQFEEPFNTDGENQMRDIHEDSDIKILKRIRIFP